MRYAKLSRAAGILALVALGACKSLDVVNPNEPDAGRALTDPAALEALAGGTLRTWWNAWMGMESAGVMATQAQSYSSSWNNFNMNFYSSLDGDGTRNSRSWQNNPAAAGRTSVEWLWTNYYSTLSSANDVIKAIREGKVVINNVSDTKRAEAVALLMQGATLSGIAMNYDKGYIVDETTDVSTLAYSNRKEIRDAAIAKLLEAATLAKANVFTTPAGWTNGRSYSNDQIARVAYTMAAMTLAFYPRNAAEKAQVSWSNVATYAAQGMNFDLYFVGTGCPGTFCPEVLIWFNDISSGRVHTRVANLLDPATQKTPYPAGGNPRPNSPDKRLGDGSFGDEDLTSGFGTVPKTANGGTDFAWSADEVFRPDRGSYHQSNMGHMRYDLSGVQDPTGIWAGYGPAPSINAAVNDLIWADALVRTGNLAQAATLINKTRVGRGGLAPASAGDGVPGLTQRLHYEYEIELLGLGSLPFYFRRGIDGLVVGTPREMPVPAKELGVLGQPLYTWGGATPSSPTPP